MSDKRREIFSGLSDNLKLVVDKLKLDRERRSDREIKLTDFWPEYEKCVSAVSSECTKLCMAFSSPPHPSSSGCEMFRERVESAALLLVSTIYKLPKSQGETLYNCIFEHTCSIVGSVQELALVIGEHDKAPQKDALQSTGGVWDLCDTLPNLPRDNKQVTWRALGVTIDLVQDALAELEDSVRMTDSKESECEEEDDDEFSLEWSEEDKNVCHACIGLIKTTKSIFKKCQTSLTKYGSCDGEQNIQDLEMCIAESKKSSPYVDDLVEALYPPLTQADVLGKSELLVGSLRHFLGVAPKMHFIIEDDMSWIEFLGKAVEHNWGKVQSLCVKG